MTEQHKTWVEHQRTFNERTGMYDIRCDRCGKVSTENYLNDAQAIADRHTEVGGFEKR